MVFLNQGSTDCSDRSTLNSVGRPNLFTVGRFLSLLISSGSTVRFSKTSVLSGRGLFSDETGGDELPDGGAFAQDGTTNKKLELRTKTNSFADIFYLQYY